MAGRSGEMKMCRCAAAIRCGAKTTKKRSGGTVTETERDRSGKEKTASRELGIVRFGKPGSGAGQHRHGERRLTER